MKSPFANSSLRNRLTVGVLVLSAIGFIGAGVGAQALLKDYLINQVDDQLLSVVNGTADRLDQAGIARDDDDDDRGPQAARATTPLNRVPTSISVTVLDPFGNLIGGIGGDRIEHFMIHTMFFNEFPKMIIKDENSTLFLLEKGVHEFKNQDYNTFIGYPKAVISLDGFKYNLNEYRLLPYDPLCISNEVIDQVGQVKVHEGKVLAIISKKAKK